MKQCCVRVLVPLALLSCLPVYLYSQAEPGDLLSADYFSTYPLATPRPPVDPIYKDVVGAPPPKPLPIEQIPAIRASVDAVFAALPKMKDPISAVENRAIQLGGRAIPIRIYRPDGNSPFPVIMFYHGGGFVLGSLDSHDDLCRSLANRARALVVSVAYRLAPEARFPAAVEDSYGALQWAVAHAPEIGGDPSRIAVAGDSAGGTLAAAVALYARDKSGPNIAEQVLIYPATNTALDTVSYFENESGYGLSRDDMRYFFAAYESKPADEENPYFSPLKAADLRGLPAAFIATAQYDVLRDDGEAYAARLHRAGVPARVTRYQGQIHGFILYAGSDATARQALQDIASALRKAFSPMIASSKVGFGLTDRRTAVSGADSPAVEMLPEARGDSRKSE